MEAAYRDIKNIFYYSALCISKILSHFANIWHPPFFSIRMGRQREVKTFTSPLTGFKRTVIFYKIGILMTRVVHWDLQLILAGISVRHPSFLIFAVFLQVFQSTPCHFLLFSRNKLYRVGQLKYKLYMPNLCRFKLQWQNQQQSQLQHNI